MNKLVAPTKVGRELVVNWHLTEACNYTCKYCFSKWEKDGVRELITDKEKVVALMDQFILMRDDLNSFDPQIKFDAFRLNLVGGETFLYKKKIDHIIQYALKNNIRLSAITNGSLFDQRLIEQIGQSFCSIGVSVDSLDHQTNSLIGRAVKGVQLDLVLLHQQIEQIRTINPNIDVKINTVVNSYNHLEDLSEFILKIKPNKWKIFKMLPSVTTETAVTDDEYYAFLDRHQHLNEIISAENNDEMINSYLMVDPLGRFFENGYGKGKYVYSRVLGEVGYLEAMNDVQFDRQKFLNRYKRII